MPVDYQVAYQQQPSKDNRHNPSDWMTAVADAAATGVPLFVPIPSPTHRRHSSSMKLSHSANMSHQNVEIEEHQRLNNPHTFGAPVGSRILILCYYFLI